MGSGDQPWEENFLLAICMELEPGCSWFSLKPASIRLPTSKHIFSCLQEAKCVILR